MFLKYMSGLQLVEVVGSMEIYSWELINDITTLKQQFVSDLCIGKSHFSTMKNKMVLCVIKIVQTEANTINTLYYKQRQDLCCII